VLRALEVRRADLRPLLAWLEQRDALFATVIAEGSDPDGLLVVPSGARTEELTLEEARAAQGLANAFVAVAQAESAKVRHLERERELRENLDRIDDELARLRHAIDLDVSRHVLAATRLARPATVGIYSAVARMAYEALERRLAQDAPTILVARSGIDPIPFVARAHLSGSRKNGPFVVVDGTASREHDLARWTDERSSPLALADRGLLFLVDGAALPRDIQALIGRAVAERRPPWERASPLDVLLALSSTAPFDALDSRLATELASRFDGSEAITLPGLHERPEDLRSIVADRLAREGLRVAGRPVGIDAAAFSRLVEYPFEGEDAELATIVTKLVARTVAEGDDVVRTHHVDALGLAISSDLGVASEERRFTSRRT
jgi:transcriptional regulator of acetoin/glycerol metabolism